MRRTILLALAALAVVGLVCVATVFLVYKPPPAITMRQVMSTRSGHYLLASFEVENSTSSTFSLSPWVGVEMSDGRAWKYCSQFNSSNPGSMLIGHSHYSFTFAITNPPTLSQLRLNLLAAEELKGVEALFRILKSPKRVSFSVFGKQKTIISDEFIVPELSTSPEPTPSAESAGSK
jgi:hypothetical protein